MIQNRIVLDTNVCLDLFVFRDPRWYLLEAALRSGAVQAVTRDDCRNEWLLVLAYPQFALDAAAQASASAAFDALLVCLPVPAACDLASAVLLPRCSDPDDQKFLELTHDATAGILITKDKALLKLAGKCRRGGLFDIMKPEAWIARQVPVVTP